MALLRSQLLLLKINVLSLCPVLSSFTIYSRFGPGVPRVCDRYRGRLLYLGLVLVRSLL